jgi:tetratricopeptide (TPR) repeat protein
VRVHTVRVGKSLVDIGNKLGHLGDSLLVGRMRSPDAADGVLGTRVLAAWQAYEDGHAARARWDLPAAVRAFRAAVETDPPFPHANLWLGQTMMWAGEPAAAWRAYAAAAAAGADRLGPRERALAGALVSLARRQYSDACGSYRNLVARDTMDFAAWFGLGECLSGDRLVVPDPQSRSGWRFRASYFAAAQSYNRALQLVPSVHRIFAGVGFARLAQLFFAESGMYRAGYALIPDSARFGAFPEESGDTLAFVPYPIDDVLAGRREANPASTASAIERNRQTVRQLASEWVEAFSGSADAHETLALALETLGEIGDATDGLALAATRRARALARDPAQQLRLAVAEVRLLVKLRRFGRARELADTLLKGAAQAAASEAAQLAALAALTGRVDRAAALLRQTAPLDTPRTWGGEPVIAPLPVKETALELLAYASLGAPLDSLRILPARVEERITTWVEPARRQRVRDAVLHVPMSFAFPQVGVSPVHRGSTGGNYLLEIQWVLARGDTGTVRARLARLHSFRAADRPGDVAIDAAYQEAALLLAVGDSAAAARLLDQLLEALPALGAALLAQVSQAGALVRAMALRAELAAQEGDGARARRWAQGVVELWSDADASLEPVVQRMRAVAAG